MTLSPKQILSIEQATKKYNIWVGAVRSGKTYSSIIKLVDLLKNGPPGDVMIIGVNRATIQRNVIHQLYMFLGAACPSSKTNEAYLYGRNVYFVGAHDESAVRAIQGATLAIAYVDELTCIPEPFFKMLETRLSIAGAQLLASCNPEGPAHFVKKQYLDRKHELDLASWTFTLEDNPSLDEKYKEDIKKSLTGAFYRRLILGEWALASGLIYDSYDELNEYENLPHQPNWRVVGIDYGTTNATCALMIGCTPTIWPQIRVEKEYYWDSVKKGRAKTDAELADDIKKFIGYHNVRAVYIDPAAASLKIELRRRDLPVIDALNDVLLGIKITSKFVHGKNIVIHKSCTNLREQMQSYVWDMKASERGEDKPLKQFDHACVTGDTKIQFLNRSVSIKDLVSIHFYSLLKLKNYNIEENKIENSYWENVTLTRENSEIYELELEDGKILRATGDHKIMTQRGYVELQHLTLLDTVLTCNTNITMEKSST